MPRPYRYRTALARALAISLLLHALASPAFVVSSSLSRAGDLGARAASETIAFAHVTPLSLDAPHRRAPVLRAAAPVHRLARTTPRRSGEPAPAANARRGAARSTPGASQRATHHAPRAALALTLATAAPERVAEASAPSRAAAEATPMPVASATAAATPATATPVPTPTASGNAVVAHVAARDGDVPLGGWGQTFARPLVADERALDDLRARFPGTRAIRIDVDDAGRAVRVVLPGNLTADARAALERELMSLSFVPAECNGLRCSGTLQISL